MFKTTLQRHREAIDFADSAREFKDEVQQGLEKRLKDRLREGEILPDLTLFQELVGRLLEESGNGVLEIDESYTSQLVDMAALREQRDRLAAQLRNRLQQARFLIDTSIGGPAAKAALRDRRLSSYYKPNLLVAAARDIVRVLRDPKHAWEEADSKAALFATAAKAAETIEAEADALEELLRRLSPQSKSNQKELGAKTAEVEAVAETNKRCKDALYGLYRLAGLDYHAERLRPKVRRRAAGNPDPAEPAPSPPMAVMRVN